MEKLLRNNIIVLIVLAVLTSFFSVATFAKFREAINSSSSDVTIAKWNVQTSNDENKNVSVIAGEDGSTFTVRVKSESEVASTYSIVVSNIPANVEVKLDDGTKESSETGTLTFDDIRTISVGDTTTYEHTLTFSTSLSSEEISNQEVTVDVIFTQATLS